VYFVWILKHVVAMRMEIVKDVEVVGECILESVGIDFIDESRSHYVFQMQEKHQTFCLVNYARGVNARSIKYTIFVYLDWQGNEEKIY